MNLPFRIPKTSSEPSESLVAEVRLDAVEILPSTQFWRFYMFKKIAILVALAFSLAASAGAMSPGQQYPLPPPDGGGNIVLR